MAADNQFQHAADLVRYIRERHGDTFCIGVAGALYLPRTRSGKTKIRRSNLGYPEGHADSDDKAMDVEYLYQKQEAGAEFVVTQLFYDVNAFIIWYRACRARGMRESPYSLYVDCIAEEVLGPHRYYNPDFTRDYANTELSIVPKNDKFVQK